jgi:hypothetical protein
MPLVPSCEVLFRYTDPTFRSNGGVDQQLITTLLRDLHGTVGALHARRIVIGDFNDLNVLVGGSQAWLIDIDSAQFGPFISAVYTTRFLDPRLTDGKSMIPIRAHDDDSDWYAFAAMAFHLLLQVEPFGGTHRPPRPEDRVAHDLRPLHRISAFHPLVRLPKSARPFDTLPDDLLHRFHETFAGAQRGAFPDSLLASLQWTRCACGSEHARTTCPRCATAAPHVARPQRVVQGRVTIEHLFSTDGILLAVEMQGDKLLWLEHRDGRYLRETGQVIFESALDPRLSYSLQPNATIVRRGDDVRIVSTMGQVTSMRAEAVAANALHHYWSDGGTLQRNGSFGAEAIGTILGGQTRFWVGPAFGLGFYRASEMTVGFVFDATSRGLRDDVRLPRIGGQLLDANAVFTNERCWLFLATQEAGRVRHRCTVIRRDGQVEATREIEPDGDDWLSHITGAAASSSFLLVPTDDGIVRVEPDRGSLAVTATFPDTEGLVDASTRLIVTREGVLAIDRNSVRRLRIG